MQNHLSTIFIHNCEAEDLHDPKMELLKGHVTTVMMNDHPDEECRRAAKQYWGIKSMKKEWPQYYVGTPPGDTLADTVGLVLLAQCKKFREVMEALE